MKHIPAIPLTTHRCARFIAWGRMMLAWVSAVMFFDLRAKRRHIRGRYGMLDPDRFARYVGNLIYLRAAALDPNANTRQALYLRRGARAKARIESAVRATRGSVLRKFLRHRDLRTRLAIFMYALDHLDDLARVFAPRLLRRLSRLMPILMAPIAADVLRSLAAPTPQVADSS